jgi:CRP-like cAMP-binding protein
LTLKSPNLKSKIAASKKPAIINIPAGGALFKEGDNATSLFIIKEGQIRLFRPKGKGFIDIAILRKGEVIGEMAYFDTQSKRRSCSASALTSIQIIEIPFVSLDKALKGLNPWLKTIVITLADRLRKTNNQLKELESNSVGYAGRGKLSKYTFFSNSDIVKGLSLFFNTMKTFADFVRGDYKLKKSSLSFQMTDIHAFPEIKLEELLKVLSQLKYIEVKKNENDDDLILAYKMSEINDAVGYFNDERRKEDAKKLNIPDKTEKFLGKVLKQLETATVDDKGKAKVNLSIILEGFKNQKVPIYIDDFTPAVEAGIAEEIIFEKGNEMHSIVNVTYLETSLPSIRLRNVFEKINREKAEPA